jgi:hypothetical protein
MFKQYLPYLVPLIFVVLIALRARRSLKGRPLNPSTLWIRPLIISVFMAVALATSPLPNPVGLAFMAVAVAAGVGVGYLLARHQAFALDPKTHKITITTSPFGTILFIGLFAARYAFRAWTMGGQAPGKVVAHSAQITLYTDIGLLFVLAFVSAQAWEIWRRTRPLAAERAARLAAKPSSE